MEDNGIGELEYPSELSLDTAITKKRSPEKVNIDILNQDQRCVFEGLLNWVDQGESAMAVLQGYAGVGKTFLVNLLIEQLLVNKTRVMFTAPTHKAVKVAQSMAQYTLPSRLTYCTIHSALGLKEKRYGKIIKYERDHNSQDKTKDVQLVIIDEASMLGKDLTNMVVDSAEDNGTMFLFVGDVAQLPPVNEKVAPPFSKMFRNDYEMPIYKLTKIVRQGDDNPILGAATYIRQNLQDTHLQLHDQFQTTSGNDGGLILKVLDEDYYNEVIPQFFTCQQFADNPDFAKVLAWTNREVDRWNAHLRYHIFKEDYLPKLVVGEKLIADKPIVTVGFKTIGGFQTQDEDVLGIVYNTNDEFVVRSLKQTQKVLFGVSLEVYEVDTEYTSYDGTVQRNEITVLHEQSEEAFKKAKDIVSNDLAKRKKAGETGLGKLWRAFYIESDKVAQVKYNYALTVHKSQGSTFQNVFIVYSNIMANPEHTERNRLLYTALTRPKENAFVLRKK